MRLLNRLMGRAMGTFVAQGVSIDDDGRLCLPDGLTPDRVQRFIELCVGAEFACPRDAMHDLFARVGVSPRVLAILNQIIHDDGDVDLSAIAHHWREAAGALPAFHEIPTRFRDFLVRDLAIADPESRTLLQAVTSTRRNAAKKLGCRADWDQILDLPEGVSALAAPWRRSTIRELAPSSVGAT
ncbi:MAG: hypothetical protein QNK05_00230 [Myxococcota bacterium]|nr:hypothetical protein [Myxococcota bacterium]